MSKITCYDFDGVKLKSLYQWDLNQTIVISGITFDEPPEVHFSNIKRQEAIVTYGVISNEGLIITVPNILLQYAVPIQVYICAKEAGCITKHTISIPVKKRAMPENYEYEDNLNRHNNTDDEMIHHSESSHCGCGCHSGGRTDGQEGNKDDENNDASGVTFDSEEFNISENKIVSIKKIDQDKIKGLDRTFQEIEDSFAELNNTKADASDLADALASLYSSAYVNDLDEEV